MQKFLQTFLLIKIKVKLKLKMNQQNQVTKEDLQYLLGQYYQLHNIETYLKECVLLYYPSVKHGVFQRTIGLGFNSSR